MASYLITFPEDLIPLRPGDRFRLQLGPRSVDLQVQEHDPEGSGGVTIVAFWVGAPLYEPTAYELEARHQAALWAGYVDEPEASGIPLDVSTYTPGQG